MDWKSLYGALLEDELKRALDALDAEHRDVLLFTTLGELTYKECAKVLEIPIGTLMSRLYRARQELKTALLPYAKERGLIRNKADQTGGAA